MNKKNIPGNTSRDIDCYVPTAIETQHVSNLYRKAILSNLKQPKIMIVSLYSEHYQNFLKLLQANRKLFQNSVIKNLMRIGVVTITLLIATSVQLLMASPLKSQPIDQVTIRIGLNNETLVQAFRKIEAQSQFHFMYKNDEVKGFRNLNVKSSKRTIEDFLKTILANTFLAYRQVNNQILIMPVGKDFKNSTASLSSRYEKFQYVPVANIVMGREITGSVKDSVTGAPLVGATVLVKGSTVGTSTDSKGGFTLNAPDDAVLLVSYSGYNSKEITIKRKNTFQILLSTTSSVLDQVIVTALGIKRQTRTLGFSEQTINSSNLSSAPSPNWSSGLIGKVAGLHITTGSTGPINSQQIQLRGASSLNLGSNGALIVIDDVPMDQNSITYGSNPPAAYGTEAPVDYGNAISELNQADIASVTILKGASGAALYGSRAANGAIIITTKTGRKHQKLGVSLNSSITFNSIIHWPEYQYEYGGGDMVKNSQGEYYYSFGNSVDGANTAGPGGYGPKFAGQQFFRYDPKTQSQGATRTLWHPYKNNRKDFYKTGVTTTNSIVLQGGGEHGSTRMGFTYQQNNYILPNTGFKRYGVSLNNSYDISKHIKLQSIVNFNNRNSPNLPGFGISNGSIGYFMMFLCPSTDMNWYKPIWQAGDENLKQLNPFSLWSSNPYYLMYVATNSLTSNELVGSTKIDAEITNHLSFSGLLSINFQSQLRQQNRGYSDKKHPQGYYGRQDVASNEINGRFMFNYDNQFGNKFKYSVMLGGNKEAYTLRDLMSSVEGLSIPGVYNLANGINNTLAGSNDVKESINSLFGQVSLAWDNDIFINITGRNDWSSTLPLENNSYFYPSISSSFILSDLFKLSEPISLLKYRLSYASVGNGASPYQTSLYYNSSGFPSSASVGTALFNNNLKPEINSSLETGFDLRLLEGRVGADVTYYTSTTKNQILTLPSNIESGYLKRTLNAGSVRNSGVEVILNGTPVKTNDFEWDVSVNWSTNKNKILELTTGLEKQTLTSIWLASFVATKGGATSDLWGKKFKRHDGKIIFENGAAMFDDTASFYGNVAPDWVGGITNNFRYKNFYLTFTFDGQFGGLLWSGTYQRASWGGFTKNTLPGRTTGTIIGKGVMMSQDGKYIPNNVPINTENYYSSRFSNAIDDAVFNNTYLKLREVSLDYSLPERTVSRLGISRLSVGLFGRNLAVLFSNYPMGDPEAGTKNGTGNIFVGGAEIVSMPMTASYGVKFNVGF